MLTYRSGFKAALLLICCLGADAAAQSNSAAPFVAALSYQFFEGNDGWAELFNDYGRKERNSFVEVIEPGPRRVWVRWTYFGVNMESGAAAFRGTEDFWAFPNGLVLRRQSYESLMPGDNHGYAREPIETIAMAPVGKLWFDVLAPGAAAGESRAFVGLDAFSGARADIFWKRQPKPNKPYTSTSRRAGAPWKVLDDARGFAGVVPFRDGSPFFVIGDAMEAVRRLARDWLKDGPRGATDPARASSLRPPRDAPRSR